MTTWFPALFAATALFAADIIREASATLEPPNFCTIKATARFRERIQFNNNALILLEPATPSVGGEDQQDSKFRQCYDIQHGLTGEWDIFFQADDPGQNRDRFESNRNENIQMTWHWPFRYLWAFPGSLVGLALVPVALLSGGGVQIVDGVIEAYGGKLAVLLRKPFWISGPISAITFGHVVLGCDKQTLQRTRRHERVHVRQYERWGPFFIPAYVLASFWIRARGGNAYLDNPFEVEAYAIED